MKFFFYFRNVVKVFYTVGLMYDVCEVFGEVSEEVASERKYAKWKATYIHNCLKNGQTPVPGPMAGGTSLHEAVSLIWGQKTTSLETVAELVI